MIRTVGAKFVKFFAVLPAEQTRGGILLAVNEDFFDLSNVELTTNTITATITMRAYGIQWKITVVYGPQGDAAKLQFLQELKSIPPPVHNRWLTLGDFNLIYQEQDKNNSNLNQHLMCAFKAAIDHLCLKEIKLNGRRFTWSNQQDSPTLTRMIGSYETQSGNLSCLLLAFPSVTYVRPHPFASARRA